jgi:hypothetical protein
MTDQHPLTDELIDELAAEFTSEPTARQVINRDRDMRAAADWQLEQVIAWLEDNLGSSMYLQLAEDNGTEVNVGYVIQHLREEMRPL